MNRSIVWLNYQIIIYFSIIIIIITEDIGWRVTVEPQ